MHFNEKYVAKNLIDHFNGVMNKCWYIPFSVYVNQTVFEFDKFYKNSQTIMRFWCHNKVKSPFSQE